MAPCIAPGDLKVKFSQIIHAMLGKIIIQQINKKRTLKIQKNKLPDWIGSERDEEGRARRSSFARTMAGPVVGDVGSE